MTPDNSNAVPTRVRMAPSPTGFFHVGSARTALFNFLFARNTNGAFVLRIEDTDQSRGDDQYEEVIYNAMAWLGLTSDEGPKSGGEVGPYRQSERFELYRRSAQTLLESGAAYHAYETADELKAVRDEQTAKKLPPRYNNAHRDLSPEQKAAFEAEGRKPVVRLRVPEGETRFDDSVYGSVTWKNSEIDDFVILKSDGGPTYNFACAVDDHEMRISHVIRGEDGLSNTPRQILIYRALGWEPPTFAHLPFLLGSDRKKLSKRSGAANLLDFQNGGIMPDAMFNYLALLGWNPGEGETQEVFSRDELVARFSLSGVNKAGAIFDPEKLAWMNTQYLKALPIAEFSELVAAQMPDLRDEMNADPDYTQRALTMARERMATFANPATNENGEPTTRFDTDLSSGARFFFSGNFPTDTAGAAKHLNESSRARMALLRDKFAALPTWEHDSIESAVRALSAELSIKPAELIHPSRLLVSGRTVGPSLFELLHVLGRERVLSRLSRR